MSSPRPGSFGLVYVIRRLFCSIFLLARRMQIIDQSGWNNRGFVFLLGLLSVQWVMVNPFYDLSCRMTHQHDIMQTDYDAAARKCVWIAENRTNIHSIVTDLAEEVQNAGQAIPLAIMTGSITTAILGFFVNVALCYGIKNISALPGPTGLVVPQILWDNLGQKGGLVVFSFIISVQTVVALTCQLSSIRCAWVWFIRTSSTCLMCHFSYIRYLTRCKSNIRQ